MPRGNVPIAKQADVSLPWSRDPCVFVLRRVGNALQGMEADFEECPREADDTGRALSPPPRVTFHTAVWCLNAALLVVAATLTVSDYRFVPHAELAPLSVQLGAAATLVRRQQQRAFTWTTSWFEMPVFDDAAAERAADSPTYASLSEGDDAQELHMHRGDVLRRIATVAATTCLCYGFIRLRRRQGRMPSAVACLEAAGIYQRQPSAARVPTRVAAGTITADVPVGPLDTPAGIVASPRASRHRRRPSRPLPTVVVRDAGAQTPTQRDDDEREGSGATTIAPSERELQRAPPVLDHTPPPQLRLGVADHNVEDVETAARVVPAADATEQRNRYSGEDTKVERFGEDSTPIRGADDERIVPDCCGASSATPPTSALETTPRAASSNPLDHAPLTQARRRDASVPDQSTSRRSGGAPRTPPLSESVDERSVSTIDARASPLPSVPELTVHGSARRGSSTSDLGQRSRSRTSASPGALSLREQVRLMIHELDEGAASRSGTQNSAYLPPAASQQSFAAGVSPEDVGAVS